MTYYLYKSPSGNPELLNHKMPFAKQSGFKLIKELREWVDTKFLVFDEDDRLVSYETQLTAQDLRRRAYPSVGEQLDMLWHAMHTGATPKVEPFYSEILAVKQKHPKPSN